MRKFLIITLLLSLAALFAQIDTGVSNADLLQLSYTAKDYQIIDIDPQGQLFKKIISAGSESLKPGAPDLPTQAVWIAIPAGKQAIISARSVSSSKFMVPQLSPVPQPAAETKGAPAPQYIIDKEIYNTNSLFPGKLADLEKHSSYRGQPAAVVRFYPWQYNPISGELILHHQIEVEISFSGAQQPIPANMYNPQMSRFIADNMINGEQILQECTLDDQQPSSRQEGCELLIVCPDEFLSAAQQLAAWKDKRGITSEIVSTSQTGSTCFNIGQWITDYSNSHDPAPQSILLLGDAEFIPPWYVHEFPGEGLMATDVYYADLDIEFDYLLDFSCGRIPVDTIEDAQRVVQNIINYEMSPPADPAFYQNAVIAGAFQDGAGEPPDTYANRRFAKTSEDIRNFLDEQMYNTQRIYTEYNGYDYSEIFPTYWNQYTYIFENDTPGGELPDELQKPQFPWNGNDLDVSTAVNNGCFLLTHRDHGGRNGWGEPSYNSNDVLALQNGELLPVVWSVNCLTGYFDNETDDGSGGTGANDECFTEYWFRNPNGGAAGVVASTRVSYSGNNDRFIWGMMDAIYPDYLDWCGANYPANNPTYRMGDVVNYAKTYLTLNATFEDYLLISFEEFEWFGDPTMEIKTVQPQQLNVSHQSTIEFGEQYFMLDAGLPGASCTLWDGQQVIASGISGLNNQVVLDIPEFDYVPQLTLTVWYSQSIPYTAQIDVTPPLPAFLNLLQLTIDDIPGNNNQQADYGETISFDLQVQNIGSQTLPEIDITLTADNEYVTVTQNNFQYPASINPDETLTLTDIFELQIADFCPDGETVDLTFSYGDRQFTANIVLRAPVLHATYFTINDSLGNNNQAIDPGEDVWLDFHVSHQGSSSIPQIPNVTVMLLSFSPWIEFYTSQYDINLMDTSLVRFIAHVSADAPLGTDYELQILVYSGEYNFDMMMSGVFGYPVEDFESADFSLFNWDMTGNYNWVIDDDAASGNYSARTELMGVNSYARLAVDGFLAEDGIIGFYRKLYANTDLPNNNGGILRFFIDDEETGIWGGNADWQFVQFEVPAGPHTFTWEFEKDNDPTTGTDGAWIDRIEFPSMTEPPPPLMAVDTQQIQIEVPQNGTAQSQFAIANNGGGSLEYYVFFDNDNRNLDGTYLQFSSYDYTPGQTSGWLVQLHNAPQSQEAVIDLNLTFPDVAQVNIATPLTGGSLGAMASDGSTGSGITVNWHGETPEGAGVLLPGETATGAVNVTFAPDAPLSLLLNAQITGENGSVITQDLEIGSLNADYITIDHNHGELSYGQSAVINIDIDAQNLAVGSYLRNLRITDGINTEIILPVEIVVNASDINENDLPQNTSLLGIFPNPFNPSTSINFYLKNEENVVVNIYNIKGQKVQSLSTGKLDSGFHQLTWNGFSATNHRCASGIYFFQIKAGDYTQTSRALMLK